MPSCFRPTPHSFSVSRGRSKSTAVSAGYQSCLVASIRSRALSIGSLENWRSRRSAVVLKDDGVARERCPQAVGTFGRGIKDGSTHQFVRQFESWRTDDLSPKFGSEVNSPGGSYGRDVSSRTRRAITDLGWSASWTLRRPPISRHARYEGQQRQQNVPEVVLLYTADSPHLTDLAPDSDDLHTHLRALLDDHILVVRELRRCRVGVPLDLARDQLEMTVSARSRSREMSSGRRTCADTKSFRGPAFAKKPW